MRPRYIVLALLAAFLAGALGGLAVRHWRACLEWWSAFALVLCWLVGPDLLLAILLPLERATRESRP
ncbi:MAG TPA: hypothetical protein VGO93_04490 [Candidatus Xenobia bacterium]|jgi:hypothetical protein